MTSIKIGTRGSALALKQTEMVIDKIKKAFPDIKTETVILKTTGDKITDKPLYAIGGKGLFVNEFEEALLKGEIDMAVHSAKDMPSKTEEPFCIPAVLKRGNPFDAVITLKDISSENTPVFGTSSPRRQIMIKRLYPNCVTENLRGNVPTRLNALKSGKFDAVILALAGIERLGIDTSEFNLIKLNSEKFIPASCQGIIALQCVKGTKTEEILKQINHSDTKTVFDIERRLMCLLGADCHDAAGVYAVKSNNKISVTAFYKNSPVLKTEIDVNNIENQLIKMAGDLKNGI